MATNDIENWLLLTTPLSIDASSRKNPSEYPHKPYIARNWSPANVVTLAVLEYLNSFSHIVSESEAEKSRETDDEIFFSIKWHLKVIQDGTF